MGKVRAGRRSLDVSNEDKIFFPDEGITKGDLIYYYKDISSTILPYLKDRPLTLHHYPDGIKKSGFYQKKVPDYFPDWIDTTKIKVRSGGSQRQVICNKKATLIYLADKACITPHIWLSKKDKIKKPDNLIFDLDPPSGNFKEVIFAAKKLKEILEEVDLTPFVMTTGSKGLHVIIALSRRETFDKMRDFAKQIATIVSERYPDKLTIETRKEQRKGRVFLDYLRNAYGQTAVTPYAVRGRKGAPVATPLDWNELSNKRLKSSSYTIKNIFKRLNQKGDPWKKLSRYGKDLKNAKRKIKELT